MKALNYFTVLFSFALFLLLGCSDQSQSPVAPSQQVSLEKLVRMDFTAFSYPTGNIDPGEHIYANGNVFLRNRIDNLKTESTNSFINATNGIITYNVNLDANTAEGYGWGTVTFTPDAHPELEVTGKWNGKITMTSPGEWTLLAKLVGHIRGGSTNGMQIFWDNIVIYHDPSATYWEGNAAGYIQYSD
jgi:hypothetical protein